MNNNKVNKIINDLFENKKSELKVPKSIKKNKKVFKKIEALVVSIFPDANYNEKEFKWTAVTVPNPENSWEPPEALIDFDKKYDSLSLKSDEDRFLPFLSGTSWHDEGNVEISLSSKYFR